MSGTPAAVLRWGWNREGPGDTPGQASTVLMAGDGEALGELRRCITEGTQ